MTGICNDGDPYYCLTRGKRYKLEEFGIYQYLIVDNFGKEKKVPREIFIKVEDDLLAVAKKAVGNRVGFYGGKFIPFHKGHMNMIMKASNYVDKLYVILFSSEKRDREICEFDNIKYMPTDVRMSWLGESLNDLDRVQILNVEDTDGVLDYDWEKGSIMVKEAIPENITHIFSSEYEYCDIFNRYYPDAEHIVIDPSRSAVDISATNIRRNVYGSYCWGMLPTAVRSFFTKKIAIVGTESCVDGDTEFFDGLSWKKISSYNNEEVLQYNEDGTAQLIIPERFIKLKLSNNDKFYKIQNSYGTWSQVYTQDHDLVYITSKGNLAKKKMIDIKNQHFTTKSGFQGKMFGHFIYGNKKLSEKYIRLALAISADGNLHRNKWRVRLKKERKIIRLRCLIKNAGYQLDERVYKDGYSNFIIPKEAGFKIIPNEWLDLDQTSKEFIIDEIFNWDGHKSDYFTTIKENAEKVQFIFNSAGYKTVWLTEDGRNENVCYRVRLSTVKYNRITMGKENFLHREKMITEYNNHNGYKYCFTVPSGMLVLRRDNHVFITGNCGKSTLTKRLAKYYKTNYVNEVGRSYCDRYKNQLTAQMFDSIAMDHYRLTEKLAYKSNKMLFVDSEAVISQYYLDMYFNKKSPLIEEIIKLQEFDLVLYLEPDVEWVDDGVRFAGEPHTRKLNNEKLKKEFGERGIKCIMISGNYEERFEKARFLVNELMDE